MINDLVWIQQKHNDASTELTSWMLHPKSFGPSRLRFHDHLISSKYKKFFDKGEYTIEKVCYIQQFRQ